MSRDLVEIVHELRMQLAKRGGLSMKTLGLAFAVNDRDRSGYFDFEEFESILGRAGLFLKRQELTKLFRYFDRDQNERVSYNEFLRGLQGELNERRTGIIRQAFQKMDKTGNGVVDMEDVVGTYDASRHPLVISGQKTSEQIMVEFLEGFKDHSTGSSPGVPGVVTWDNWVEYYRGISASIVDDDYFVYMMEQSWRITESSKIGSDVPIELVHKIENVLREKIRQKTSSTAAESETLRKAFKHFDIDESQSVSYAEFLFALERFGIVLEEKVSRALFDDFDTNRSGRISYTEFAKVLYRVDPLATGGASTVANVSESKEASAVGATGYEDWDANYYGDAKTGAATAATGSNNGVNRPASRPLSRPQGQVQSVGPLGAAGAAVVRPPSRPLSRPLSRPQQAAQQQGGVGGGARGISQPQHRAPAAAAVGYAPSPFRNVANNVVGR